MKPATLNEIRRELSEKSTSELREICLRLAKYKVENKELLNYLLFEADNEDGYISAINAELVELFDTLPKGNVYFVKKGLRRILRILNKHIRYSALPKTEVETRLQFCQLVIAKRVPLRESQVIMNMYAQQLGKIDSALARLPEEQQLDYEADREKVRI